MIRLKLILLGAALFWGTLSPSVSAGPVWDCVKSIFGVAPLSQQNLRLELALQAYHHPSWSIEITSALERGELQNVLERTKKEAQLKARALKVIAKHDAYFEHLDLTLSVVQNLKKELREAAGQDDWVHFSFILERLSYVSNPLHLAFIIRDVSRLLFLHYPESIEEINHHPEIKRFLVRILDGIRAYREYSRDLVSMRGQQLSLVYATADEIKDVITSPLAWHQSVEALQIDHIDAELSAGLRRLAMVLGISISSSIGFEGLDDSFKKVWREATRTKEKDRMVSLGRVYPQESLVLVAQNLDRADYGVSQLELMPFTDRERVSYLLDLVSDNLIDNP